MNVDPFAGRGSHALDSLVVGHFTVKREVGVRVQTEDLGRVDLRQTIAIGAVLGDLLRAGHDVLKVAGNAEDGVGRVVAEALLAGGGAKPHLRVGLEEVSVQVVRDLAAVLSLGHHVLKRRPRDRPSVQVPLQEADAGGQVSVVVLVRYAPAQAAVVAALLDDAVQEAQREQQLAPLRRLHALQAVLVHHDRVGPQEPRLQPRGRVVGDLGGHLQQSQGKLFARQRGNKESEAGVDALVQVGQEVLHLHHEVDAQLAILQQDPRAVLRRGLHGALGHGLLALAHGDDIRRRQLLLPAQLLDSLRGVGADGQEEDDRHRRDHAVVDVFQLVRHGLDILDAHLRRLADEVFGAQLAAVHAQHAHHQQAEEGADVLVLHQATLVVRHRLRLRLIVLVPVAPHGLVGRHVVGQVHEEALRLRQLVHVEPGLVAYPNEGLAADVGGIQASAALQQEVDVAARQETRRHQDLHGHQQHEGELVFLVQAAVDVAVHHVGQGVGDVDDAGGHELRLLGAVHGVHEDLHELRQRRLVHHVHIGHLHDGKVHHGATARHRPELLALLVDVGTGLRRRRQLLLHLGGLLLGVGQDADELLVLKQVALVGRQALQQRGVQRQQGFGVRVDLLEDLVQPVLQRRLLLGDDLAQQLLLEALLRDREVDDGGLGLQLRAERGVRQPREEEAAEGRVEVHLLVGQCDEHLLALLLDLLLQQRVQHGIDLRLDAHHDHGIPVAHGELQLVSELRVVQRRHPERRQVVLLALPDPAQRLTLRIDKQGEALRAGHEDAVLDAQRVGGEALHVPVADGPDVNEELDDVDLLGDRHAAADAVRHEVLVDEVRAELLVEGAAVAHEGAGDGAVAHEASLLVGEVVGVLRPSRLLAGQALDERRRLVHLSLERGGAVLDAALLRHLRVEHGLQGVQLGLAGLEARFGGGESLVGQVHLPLCDGESLELGLDDLGGMMILGHGPHPDAQALCGHRGVLGDVLVEALEVEDGPQQVDGLLVDLVFAHAAEFHHAVQEVGVTDHLDAVGLEAGLDEGHLHAPLELQGKGLHRRHFLHEQNHHAVEHQLDDVARVGQLLDLADVCRLDGVDGRLGLVDERLRLGQVRLALALLLGDARRVLFALGLDLLHLLAFLLRLGAGHLEVGQHGVGLLGGLGQLHLLHRQDLLEGLDILRPAPQLLQAQADAALLVLELVELDGVGLLEVLDEAEVALGRLEHLAPHPLKVLLAGRGHQAVHHAHVRDEALLLLRRALDGVVLDEASRHADQRLLGPLQEPVDGGHRREAGELLRPLRELRIHGTHAQHDVQVVADAVDEELAQGVGRLRDVGSFLEEIVAQLRRDAHDLLLGEEARHVPGEEDAVHELQEDFVLDLALGEQEHRRLALLPGAAIQLLQVVHEALLVVALGERDLEALGAGDVRAQARQALLAAAADADEEARASRHLHEAVDAQEMHQCVLEQHEVHLLGGEVGVVALQEVQAPLADGGDGAAHLVHLGRQLDQHVLLVIHVVPKEAHHVHAAAGLAHQLGPKVLLREGVQPLLEGRLVVVVRQLVGEDAGALVLPEGHHERGRREVHLALGGP
eukprot:scaffold486_cov254-Pinguiococcus_pyrenoidosus.AAC.2